MILNGARIHQLPAHDFKCQDSSLTNQYTQSSTLIPVQACSLAGRTTAMGLLPPLAWGPFVLTTYYLSNKAELSPKGKYQAVRLSISMRYLNY